MALPAALVPPRSQQVALPARSSLPGGSVASPAPSLSPRGTHGVRTARNAGRRPPHLAVACTAPSSRPRVGHNGKEGSEAGPFSGGAGRRGRTIRGLKQRRLKGRPPKPQSAPFLNRGGDAAARPGSSSLPRVQRARTHIHTHTHTHTRRTRPPRLTSPPFAAPTLEWGSGKFPAAAGFEERPGRRKPASRAGSQAEGMAWRGKPPGPPHSCPAGKLGQVQSRGTGARGGSEASRGRSTNSGEE